MEEKTYIVNWKAQGYTAPNEQNPKGIKITGEGFVVAHGSRPTRNFDIPIDVIQQCKKTFMERCQVVKFLGDTSNCERFPTVWLDKPKPHRQP